MEHKSQEKIKGSLFKSPTGDPSQPEKTILT